MIGHLVLLLWLSQNFLAFLCDSCASVNFALAKIFTIQVQGVLVPMVSRYMGLPFPSSCIITIATADFVKHCKLRIVSILMILAGTVLGAFRGSQKPPPSQIFY